MKRWDVLALVWSLIFACAACSGQTASRPDAEMTKIQSEQVISGVSVRVPSTQYRLARTQLRQLTFGSTLLPDSGGGAVLIGQIRPQDDADQDARWTDAAECYTADQSCTVQALPVSENGFVAQTAMDENRLFYMESVQREGQTRWILHAGERTYQMDETLSDVSALRAMAVLDGRILLAADDDCVLACNPDGTLLWRHAADGMDRFFRSREGQILGWSRREQKVYVIKDGGIETLCELPALFCTGTEQVYPGDNTPYDCLVFANDACFGWSIGENAVTQIFTCDAVGLYAADVEAFCGAADGQFLGLEYNPSDDDALRYRLFRMTPVEGKLPERSLIRVAGSRSSAFSMAVRDFMSLYPEYRVEFVDYAEQYGEQAHQQLLMDLLYGDSLDLLFVNGLPFEQYARQGLLEDLYAWIDADETLARTDFTANLLHALETDGRLFWLPQTYMLETAAGLTELVGEQAGWSMEAFLDAAQAHPEVACVFAQEDGQAMIQQLLLHAPAAFIEYETATAHFDSQDFLRLLKLAKAQRRPEAETGREALLNGECLLEMLTAARAQEFEADCRTELNACTFVGFPGAGAADFYLTLPMAIPVRAQEKEGAWAFLRLLCTNDCYAARTRSGWLPLQSDFDEKTAGMTDAGARSRLRALQAAADTVFYYDAVVQTILAEELPYFFSGAQSAQQIAKRIQGRVTLYLEEVYS